MAVLALKINLHEKSEQLCGENRHLNMCLSGVSRQVDDEAGEQKKLSCVCVNVLFMQVRGK